MFEASIKVKDSFDNIAALFSKEDRDFKRSGYELRKLGDGTAEFFIKAEDISAFRATINSITQVLTVYNKVKVLTGSKNV